jgi:hypothetical protein
MRIARPLIGLLAGLWTVLLVVVAAAPASANVGQSFGTINYFIRSAQENAEQTAVTLPLHRGTSHGQTVWYIVTEAADRGTAAAMGVNYAPKLEAAKGTAAIQTASVNSDGSIDFPATVAFGKQRIVVPGCAPTNTCSTAPRTAFPPAAWAPPAVGEAGYSPLIQLPDGTILNAPQVANASGQADKVISLDTAHQSVLFRETEGRYDNRVVHYISTDASFDLAAALEDVTYAPALGAAPHTGCADPAVAVQPCSREPLIAFTNGRTAADDPNRQGLSSAILDGLSPLNILKEIPEGQADPGFPAYSPIWDIHAATWSQSAINAGLDTRQADFSTVFDTLTSEGLVTVGAGGFVVDCPAVSMNPSK